jgi:hypothetical protein
MATLVTSPHLEAPDDFYEALIEAHKDLDMEESQALNARLILLLANHVGRMDVLKEALAAARKDAKVSADTPRNESTA